MSNQLNDKLEQYDILYIQKVKYFLEQPINQLYRELVKQKRKYYEPNQRIVFVDSVPTIDTKPFYSFPLTLIYLYGKYIQILVPF